jgi:hypothetical protein
MGESKGRRAPGDAIVIVATVETIKRGWRESGGIGAAFIKPPKDRSHKRWRQFKGPYSQDKNAGAPHAATSLKFVDFQAFHHQRGSKWL